MDLKLVDFLYDLPEDRIAKYPPEIRGRSKLLYYNSGVISHHRFTDIPQLLPKGSLLVFNDTKVIPARIIMRRDTGASVEVFLLKPIKPSQVCEEVMNERESCIWKCMIGNAKKWKIGTSLEFSESTIQAERISEDKVQFNWNNQLPFSAILAKVGKTPLPPYIDREVNREDADRYQTVYSKINGAVAAPTAGLHFTEGIIQKLSANGVKTDYLTLHVSSGTFQPIKSEKIEHHLMHNEQIWISKNNLENLLYSSDKTVAVGTTSMRTIESLYWYGVKLLNGETSFFIDKKDPYRLKKVKKKEALSTVLNHLIKSNLNRIGGHTEIFLYPGYEFQMCDGLVTNYHLPGSTLILLIAAFVGEDWRRIYREALNNDYQFLSYGDGSLLMKKCANS
ncbi:MAG: S-adenosylmethionine:tRNA ribosyltransferase-isomerase [Ekhidna sp.]|nr:S-adenosylmethionine:tRNA ribosyltransferase-isomerase [Ekhidna sp.]